MSSFKDGNGKEWHVEINVAQVRLIRSRLKWDDGRPLDLSRMADDNLKSVGRLLDDIILLVDTVWLLCAAQAKESGVTAEQFDKALKGEPFARMIDAFLESLEGFFPSPAQQTMLRKMRETMAMVETDQVASLEAIDIKEEMRKAKEKAEKEKAAAELNGSSGGQPASAASTPAPGP